MSQSSMGAARAFSLALTLVGGVAAAGITIHTGRTNPSHLLIAVMSVWVFAPFALLLVLHAWARRWPASTRQLFYAVASAMAIVMPLIYRLQLFRPARSPNAFLFVLVPPVACLLIGVTAAVLTLRARRATVLGQP